MADPTEFHVLKYMNELPDNRRAEFHMAYLAQRKDRVVSIFLSFFLGGLGIDRFYLGQIGLGVLKLVLNPWTCFLWALIDLFLIMGATDAYNREVVRRLKIFYPTTEG